MERLALDREADMTGFCAKIAALQPTHIIDMVRDRQTHVVAI